MVEIPITILNSDLVEQYKSNGQVIYPYVSFSPHSVTGTPTQACPASYKTHPVNTVKVDNDNYQYEVEIPRGLAPFQVKTIWLFDQEDQLIGYATVDLPYLGSAKLSVRLLINYTGWPGADPWENMNQMVNAEINTLESWRANAEAIDTGIPRLWNRTIYVDQQNGDDENPGTQDSPVASLQKAVDLIPVGGRGEVYLLSDYVLDNDIFVTRKHLLLRLNGRKISTQWYQQADYAAIYQFNLGNAYISVLLSQADENGPLPQIKIPTNGTGLPVYIAKMSLFYVLEWNGFSGVTIRMSSKATGYPVEIRDGSLIGGQDWDRLGSVAYLGITGVYNHDVLISTEAYLIRMGHSTWHFATQPDITFVDENGSSINLASKIYGIIRDDNGIPRNIVSNILL